jgi:Icc-related predicted phosphoesterase
VLVHATGERQAEGEISIEAHEPPGTQNRSIDPLMKIQLFSDLHLEVPSSFVPEPVSGAELLVLAGDIGSYQGGSQLAGNDFGLEHFSPLPQYGAWPQPVLFVPGNHEYDGLDFDEADTRLRQCCDRLGIRWLEREMALIDGVRFLGTTLWSDFDALTPPDASAELADKLRNKAMRAANFYLTRTGAQRNGAPFVAEGVREQALVCQTWLREALAAHFDGPTVVVTHFAPSLHSADPRYGLAPGTAGFCNALDELLERTTLWLHGHLHCHNDYRHRGCRVVANPLGYAKKGEQVYFRSSLLIDTSG